MIWSIKERSDEAKMRDRINNQGDKVNIFRKNAYFRTCLRSDADKWIQTAIEDEKSLDSL